MGNIVFKTTEDMGPDEYVFSEEEIALKAALDAMELPESEPVAGWTCTVPHDREAFEWRKNYHGQMGWDLTPEARDWCDENMRHPFWVLGEAHSLPTDRAIEVYFTDETDYIHFKMMYG